MAERGARRMVECRLDVLHPLGVPFPHVQVHAGIQVQAPFQAEAQVQSPFQTRVQVPALGNPRHGGGSCQKNSEGSTP